MNYKRNRPKIRRAGCLLCKPKKMNGWGKSKRGHRGFGKLRRLRASLSDMRQDAR